MRRLWPAFALALGLAGACTAAPEQMTADAQALDITLGGDPDALDTGENRFDVRVIGADGVPVTDADVSVELVMPATPSMSEMRSTIPLEHEGEGRYAGTGSVTMAGEWDATVHVTRGDAEIGSRTFDVTAR